MSMCLLKKDCDWADQITVGMNFAIIKDRRSAWPLELMFRAGTPAAVTPDGFGIRRFL